MKKVIVVGCSGAGKSTFSRKLRDKTGLTLYYLDIIWHKADKTTISREEFDMRLSEILKKDEYIIDGDYSRTIELRLKDCDTVFFLDFPLDVCLEGVSSRIGTKREEMPWIETAFDKEFYDWIVDWQKNQRQRLIDLLDRYKDKVNVVIFKTRDEADSFIRCL